MIKRLFRITPMSWFVILAVVAVVVALGMPPDPHTLTELHTSATAYRAAVFVLLIPYAIIWYCGFYAFAKLREYASYIKKTREGYAFRQLSLGMGVLAFGLVVPTIISQLLNGITRMHPGFVTAQTIIDNYITIIVAVAALTFLSNGSHALAATGKLRMSLRGVRILAVLFILVSTVYTWLVFHNHHTYETYRLATGWLIVTFIAPYLYAWFAGLACAFELQFYAMHTAGLLYWSVLKQFAAGLTVVVLGSIAIQFVASSLPTSLRSSLGPVLLIDYALILTVAIGLIIIAVSTKKLKRIEEV